MAKKKTGRKTRRRQRTGDRLLRSRHVRECNASLDEIIDMIGYNINYALYLKKPNGPVSMALWWQNKQPFLNIAYHSDGFKKSDWIVRKDVKQHLTYFKNNNYKFCFKK